MVLVLVLSHGAFCSKDRVHQQKAVLPLERKSMDRVLKEMAGAVDQHAGRANAG